MPHPTPVVAFMAATYLMLPAFRLSIPRGWLRRAAAWQPALYGTGMLLFAGGFALAGTLTQCHPLASSLG